MLYVAAAVDRTEEENDAAIPRMAFCSGESVKSIIMINLAGVLEAYGAMREKLVVF